jgi:hypothetical protein
MYVTHAIGRTFRADWRQKGNFLYRSRNGAEAVFSDGPVWEPRFLYSSHSGVACHYFSRCEASASAATLLLLSGAPTANGQQRDCAAPLAHAILLSPQWLPYGNAANSESGYSKLRSRFRSARRLRRFLNETTAMPLRRSSRGTLS